MDLNERIAARRRELDLEAKQARIADEKRIESEKKKQQAEIISVIHRRAEQDMEPPITAETTKQNVTDAEFEKALNEAALDQMTLEEKWSLAILVICCIGGFFIAWWVGLGFMLCAGFYMNNKVEHYKKQIIAESRQQNRQNGITTDSTEA